MWDKFFSILVIPQDKQQNVYKFKIRWAVFLLASCLVVLSLGLLLYMYFQVFFISRSWKDLSSLEEESGKNQEQVKLYKKELLDAMIAADSLRIGQNDVLIQSNLSQSAKPASNNAKQLEAQAAKDGILSIISDVVKKNESISLLQLVNYFNNPPNPIASFPQKLPLKGMLVSSFGTTDNPFFPSLVPVQGVLIASKESSKVLAPLAGIVSDLGSSEHTSGFFLEVYHGSGVKTLYSGLKSLQWEIGDEITENEVLGELDYNEVVVGGLLYYQILLYGVPQNPMLYLNP